MTTENQNPENTVAENQTAEKTTENAETQNIEINLDTEDKNELVEKAMLLISLGSQMLNNKPSDNGKKRKVIIDISARITIK